MHKFSNILDSSTFLPKGIVDTAKEILVIIWYVFLSLRVMIFFGLFYSIATREDVCASTHLGTYNRFIICCVISAMSITKCGMLRQEVTVGNEISSRL
jgi:hypothetical protein